MKIFITILFLINVNTFADYKCGEHPKEDPKYDWTHLSDVNVKAVIINLSAKLCIGLTNGELDVVTYRNDKGSFQIYEIDKLRNGKVVLLYGESVGLSMVRKGPLMTLNLSNEVNTQDYKRHDLELKFVRNLKESSSYDARVLKFSLNKNHSDNDLRAYYTEPKRDEFNTLDIKINFGLKVKEIVLKDFEITRHEIDTEDLAESDVL